MEDESDDFSFKAIGNFPVAHELQNLANGMFSFVLTLTEPMLFNLTFEATDSFNASSILRPRLHVCGCQNGGNCTLDNLLNPNAVALVMSCDCPEGKCNLT